MCIDSIILLYKPLLRVNVDEAVRPLSAVLEKWGINI